MCPDGAETGSSAGREETLKWDISGYLTMVHNVDEEGEILCNKSLLG